jgi:histone deacetylase 1/2
VPLKFWDEAFLTVVYLINRPLLASSVKNQITAFFALLEVLGGLTCAPFSSRKLQFRSKQCVFLGYSNLHKGFKCLDPAEGRIYISRDVVFDEHLFPFASLRPNAGAQLRAEMQLLPDILLNSTAGLGNDNLLVPHVSSSSPAKHSPSSGEALLSTGTNLEQEGNESAAQGTPYHMFLRADNNRS